MVDYCGEFVLIGGEPLLYKELPEVVEYIGNNYRDKIATFSITTNGTILPSAKLRSVCRENNVTFLFQITLQLFHV